MKRLTLAALLRVAILAACKKGKNIPIAQGNNGATISFKPQAYIGPVIF